MAASAVTAKTIGQDIETPNVGLKQTESHG